MFQSGSFDAYHIGYRKIRENHNGNGKTIWTFDQNLYTYTVLGNNFPFPPYNGDAQTGKMTQKSDYNSTGTLLRQETYTYSKSNNWSTTLGQIVKASDVICTGNYPEPPPPPYPHNYFLAEYQITIHGLRTMTTTTLLDGVSTITTNEYDATSRHMAPVASYFTNSDGLVTRSEFKYPVDMSAGAVKDTLIKRNILVAWESIKKVNTVQVDGERTNFGLYSTTGYTTYQGPVASGGNPYPSTVLRYEAAWVTKGTFDNYDLAGNPRQFTMANWPQETYEWQNGQIKKRTYQNFIWEYTYFNNTTRLLTSTKNIDGQIINYSYDALMRLSTISSRGGNVVTTNSYNYYLAPGTYNKITTSTNFTSIPNSYLLNKTEIKYLDGLGRLVETVRKHPTTGKDVAFAIAYDALGRVSKEFIAFEGSGNTGAFISVLGTHPNKLTTYEPSPLNRVASVTPPSWYATTYTYGANTTNEVNLNGGASFYSAGTINKATSTDAQGNISHTYKDKKGLTVMTRKVNSLDAKTLYDFDDKDRLIMVVPPGATAASTGLIFTYTYDAADRMTQKKIPDANAVNMTYNIRDQLAFMQDGNLSILTKYIATQYDDYGRVFKKGFSTSTSTPLTPTFTEVHTENYYDGHNGTSQVINLTTNPQYRGKLYISKAKILGSTNDILTKTFTYDSYGRTTNITGNNHLALSNSNAESLSMAYDFDDNNTTENRTHTNGITTQNYNQRKVYDELARFHDYNVAIGGPENLAARYEYNYRNERTESNQHWGGSAWLQSIDFAYNDQGWLTTINSHTLGGTNIAFPTCTSSVVNPGTTTVGQDIDTKDLFYMRLQYDSLHSGLSGTLRKDGNIAQAIWRVRGRERQAYSYSYDGLQRISTATYSDINDAGTVTASNRYNTSYTYADLRGNISNLQRNGLYLNGPCYTQALMDNLTYTHTSGTNKISSITDAAMSAQGGFRAASGGYTYDANGNLLTNGAKGITSISYNHLNLPTNITITGGKTIDFTYAADGSKLRKVVKTGATINLVQEYIDGIEYRGTAIPATTLEAIYHSEGRLFNNAGSWKREYTIKDHLGDTRIAYCDLNTDGVIAIPSEILQENNYDAFGYGLDGVLMNHANNDNLYQYNNKEFNGDHGLSWLDFGKRWYDPAISRFTGVDPIADEFPHVTTYNYAENEPIANIDLWGLQKVSFKANLNGGTIGAEVKALGGKVGGTAKLAAKTYFGGELNVDLSGNSSRMVETKLDVYAFEENEIGISGGAIVGGGISTSYNESTKNHNKEVTADLGILNYKKTTKTDSKGKSIVSETVGVSVGVDLGIGIIGAEVELSVDFDIRQEKPKVGSIKLDRNSMQRDNTKINNVLPDKSLEKTNEKQ